MIKSDLVWRIRAQNPHLHLQDVEKIVDVILDEITASLARGERIELRGFGAFSVKVREARTGRNPRTGVLVPVPKRAAPHFKAGQEMKERLNRREE
jgi:integration host factor subunit beta